MKFSRAALSLFALSAVSADVTSPANDATTTGGTHHRVATSDCGASGDGIQCRANTDEINLETDQTIDFEIDGRTITFEQDPGTFGQVDRWSGTNPNSEGDATIVARPDADGNQVIYASVVDMERGEICQVGPDADGNEMVRCTQSSQFPDEEEPEDRRATRKLRPGANNAVARDLQGTSTFDIMVVWTRKAECFRSGLGSGCTLTSTTENNMRGLIDVAIQETNDAYTASGVMARLRLVHAYRDNNYVEPSSDTFGTTLSRLKGTSDGFLDDVHQKRSQHAADIVAMLIEGGGSCGIGYVGPSKDWMFSVTGWSCATGHYTFGHEVGHNLGCNHDRGTKGCQAGYNYGYRDPAASFRTVMAYNCVSGQCDNNAGGGCTRVKRFSNPQKTYNGKTTGLANLADCARHINEVRAEVEDYYQASCPDIQGYDFVPGKDSHGNDIQQLPSLSVAQLADWCDNNNSCKAFNTNGWVKHTVASSLTDWNSAGPCDGVYIKQNVGGGCDAAGCQDCKTSKLGTGAKGCACAACEKVVCDHDSWCCSNEWDHLCQGHAEGMCDMCSNGPANPPTPQPTNPPTPQPTNHPTSRPTGRPTPRPTERPTPSPMLTPNVESGVAAWADGGAGNTASGDYSVVSGGASNMASGDYSSVAGGKENVAEGFGSAVAGGASNKASGQYGYIGGGVGNEANGLYSASWGSNAHATHDRSAVFDFSDVSCDSQEANSVRICAENGLVVNDKNIGDELDAMLQVLQDSEARVSALESLVATMDARLAAMEQPNRA